MGTTMAVIIMVEISSIGIATRVRLRATIVIVINGTIGITTMVSITTRAPPPSNTKTKDMAIATVAAFNVAMQTTTIMATITTI